MAHTKADHPLPARIMHYVNLVCMVLLAATGFYIHKPNFSLFGMSMNLARQIHFYFMFIVVLNVAVRFYWALFGRARDIREFLPVKENRGKFFEIIKYYLFLRKTHPETGKYNTLQKSTYNLWFFLIIVQALTGFSIYWKTAPFWASLNDAVGGLLMMRFYHYVIMWVFVLTAMIHVYLSVFEDFKGFLLMFFGIESEEAH